MSAKTRTVLILGGTREATAIADRLAQREGMRVISSLAGRTATPKTGAGEWRIGGFGGVEGLAAYLRGETVDILIDATHPFAETMSRHAYEAASEASVRLLALLRPAWLPQSGDRWTDVRSLEDAAEAIPERSRTFLALGRQHIAAFSVRSDVHFIVRMVDPPTGPLLLASYDIVTDPPGNTASDEAELFRSKGVECIVCRNSGGSTYEKIGAARSLSIPVIMIARPASPSGRTFATVDELVASID